jgi:peroxiredoxin
MKIRTVSALFSVFLLISISGFRGPSSSGLQVGDKAKDFKLLSTTGKTVSLSSLGTVKGAIVIFTCNHCPFSVAYEDRIIALHNKYADQGYPVIAINPNDPVKVPDDSYENMQKRALEKGFPFDYIYDETQATARSYGASRTPHVFVLTKQPKGFYVSYIGGIDDNTDEPQAVTKKYVEKAVDELIAGKPVTTPFTKAIGCSIKWAQK